MSYEIIVTDNFQRKTKKLSKKYKSLKEELSNLVSLLIDNPKIGTSIGNDCFKIRLAIKSKGKGKSGGLRLITYVKILNQRIFLIDIYDKSEHANISNKELTFYLNLIVD